MSEDRYGWLDKHNQRRQEEHERLSRELPLRPTWREDWAWHLSVMLLRVISPVSKLHQRIMRWQHSRRAEERKRANGPW